MGLQKDQQEQTQAEGTEAALSRNLATTRNNGMGWKDERRVV